MSFFFFFNKNVLFEMKKRAIQYLYFYRGEREMIIDQETAKLKVTMPGNLRPWKVNQDQHCEISFK
jgi:hypothetical protein